MSAASLPLTTGRASSTVVAIWICETNLLAFSLSVQANLLPECRGGKTWDFEILGWFCFFLWYLWFQYRRNHHRRQTKLPDTWR